MGNDKKWIDWDKPETILSRQAAELTLPEEYIRRFKPGAFRFNDGTTQGWKIDQLYDTHSKTLKKIVPYHNPSSNQFFGFSLKNFQNLALAIGAYPFMTPGVSATSLDFYLISPELKTKTNWDNINGYRFDLQRNFFSLCFDPPLYSIQLQVQFWDKEAVKMRTFAEVDKNGKWVFHFIKSLQPYQIQWTADIFSKPEFVLRFLRIRFTQPNLTAPGTGECLPKGEWLIGNISPA